MTLNVISSFGSPYSRIWIWSVLSNTKLYFNSFATAVIADLILSRIGLIIVSDWRARMPSWPNRVTWNSWTAWFCSRSFCCSVFFVASL